MRGTLFAMLLALALAQGAPVQAASFTDATIAEAGAALDRGDVVHAMNLIETALALRDLTAIQRGRLLLDRGLAQELSGAGSDAMTSFTAALQTRALPAEERAQALLQRGFLLDAQGRLSDAAQDYSAVVLLKAGAVATALNNRANIYRRQNKLDQAQRDYRAALAQGDARPQFAYYGLGQIAETQHDALAARDFYAKAVAADPGYQPAAQRLEALGGLAPGTPAQTDAITLHPPGTPAQTDAVTLHPPPPSPAPDRLAPKRHVAPVAKHLPQPAAEPDLRPMLDDSRVTAGPEVQLGAWRSQAEAQAGWTHAQAKAGKALAGFSPRIAVADLPGKGRYYRLRLATQQAADLCVSLRAYGLDCLPGHD